MKWKRSITGLMGSLLLSALGVSGVLATPLVKGAVIEERVFNDCAQSVLTVINDYPDSIVITDAMDPACVGFANLHAFSFSDGGDTAAVFNNDASFRFAADVTISGAGEGEGGLRLSPWWSKFADGRFMLNATTGEIACFGGRLPFYSFTVGHGINYVKGTTVRLEMIYRPNGLNADRPATIQYRLTQGGTPYESPVLPFDEGNTAEDPPHGLWGILNDARAGGYFQARANTGQALTITWANIEFAPLGTPCPDAAAIEARVFNDCALSTLTVTNDYPASIVITDAMDPSCVGFANLHAFSFSADDGATAAVFNNTSDFRFGADVTIAGAGEGEGGLRLSPWWSPYADGRFMLNATTGEVACFGGRLPFYSFTAAHGIHYVKGTTVRMEMIYHPNGLSAADPGTIQYRLIQGGTPYESPVLPFDEGNAAEDPPHGLWGILNEARAGGYFQARANTGAELTATWANITFSSGECASEADVTPPTLTVSLTPDLLWPPNHRMVDVHANVVATDDSGEEPTVSLVSVTSDEPDNAKGDGNFPNDIQGVDPGADTDFQLRAERQGGGDGRTYTVCYSATDAAGNLTTTCVTCVVPHDQSSGEATIATGASGATLVIHGRPGASGRSVTPGSLVLGTDAADRISVAARPSFEDRDADGVEDAVYRLSDREQAWAENANRSGATLFARWSSGGTVYLATLAPPGSFGNDPPPAVQLAVSVRPNPAWGRAVILCALPREMPVQLSVFDVAGREVARIVEGVLPAGVHALSWKPSPSAGSGFYLYRLRTPEGTLQGRFVVFR